jgi:hypothetical protein
MVTQYEVWDMNSQSLAVAAGALLGVVLTIYGCSSAQSDWTTLTAEQLPDSPNDTARTEAVQPTTMKDGDAGIDPVVTPPAPNDATHHPSVIAAPLSQPAPH